VSPIAFAAVLPALALGSFLNVVVARVPLRRSIVSPPSSCMACGHEVGRRDNIPILSWIVLRGRCRHCGAGIPVRYPAVELLTTLLVVGCFAVFGGTAYALLAAGFCVTMVVLAAIDLDHRIVPNRIVLPAAAITLVAHTAIDPSVEWTLAALGAATFLFAAALVYPAGLGMGDVKLALLLGAMLGRNVTLALMIGFVTALLPSVVLFARYGARARKMAIPLVPFLALGAVVALFSGGAILDWYLGLSG
jgi:leader peptidase (prepilin peptidase)/N-methyltransferase